MILLAAALIAGLVANAVPNLLQRLDYFRVRRVEIAGLQYLAPGTVIGALGLESDATVFDDLVAAGDESYLPGEVEEAHAGPSNESAVRFSSVSSQTSSS